MKNHIRSIPERFARVAERFPDEPAILELGQDSVTATQSYRELDAHARRYAAALQDAGINAGDGVMVPACAHAGVMAAYLGCVSLGAYFVPFNPTWPKLRLEQMIEDTRAQAAVALEATDCTSSPIARLRQVRAGKEALDTLVQRADDLDQAGYVMYTSGSTGRPKGVVVPQRAILRLVVDTDFMPLSEQTRFLQLAPQTFDAATLEIWGPLLNGGCCVLAPPAEVPDPVSLGAIIDEHDVNAMWLTASLFNYLVDHAPQIFRPLQFLLTGGEALSVPHVVRANAALPNTQLINGYGPTENTTFTCCYRIPKDFSADANSVPIGAAIRGTRIRIDTEVEPEAAATRGVGELIAEGEGVALGYLHRPEETERRFITDAEGDVIGYRTGDLVRQRDDGLIEFVGRRDDQVKLNGFRIELGEIDHAAQRLEGVLDCRTVVRTAADGGRKLLTFYVGTASEDQVRTGLRDELPQYMMPARIARLDSLPLNDNGKLDQQRLPDLTDGSALGANGGSLAGAGNTAECVAEIWRRCVSDIGPFGLDDNFFDAGGTSLEIVQVVEQSCALSGREIPVTKAFEFPTVRSFARFLDEGAENSGEAIEVRAGKRKHALARRRNRQHLNT